MATDRFPIVWCPYFDGRVNLDDGRRFGRIHVLFRSEIFPDNSDELAPRLVKRATQHLRHFRPDMDYLCLVGSPLYISLCSLVLGRLFPNDEIKALRFDRIEQGYYEIPFAVEEHIEEKESVD